MQKAVVRHPLQLKATVGPRRLKDGFCFLSPRSTDIRHLVLVLVYLFVTYVLYFHPETFTEAGWCCVQMTEVR